MKERYDVVITGSGLAGLVAGVILSMEGKSVCILEKNNQFGGNLQTFSRDKTVFDTGVHYLGSLEKGENLHQIFSYLGIMDKLRIARMDTSGYDVISFDDDPEEYPHANSYQGFADALSVYFPSEKKAIEAYCELLKDTCSSFPLYDLEPKAGVYSEIFGLNAKAEIEKLTDNETLRAVLAGSNFLYAGKESSPLYIHALSVNSYLKSAWRCINGGSQITKQLIKSLKEHGGETYKYQEVAVVNFEQDRVASVVTKQGKTVSGDLFVFNIDLKQLIGILPERTFRKSFVDRVNSLKPVISAFSVYVVLKPGSFPYRNKNYYHFKSKADVWSAQEYSDENWPKSYMVSFNATSEDDEFAEALTILTYMKFDEVSAWADTKNTVAEKENRGSSYEEFKSEKAEIVLDEVGKKFPGLRDCIQSVHTSTPLSYRDYIGNDSGTMYGYEKDSADPMRSTVAYKTKVENLLLTGQSASVHGILGVTLGALNMCADLLGREYLLGKIKEG